MAGSVQVTLPFWYCAPAGRTYPEGESLLQFRQGTFRLSARVSALTKRIGRGVHASHEAMRIAETRNEARVHREVESERSRRQRSGLTNRKRKNQEQAREKVWRGR